jgi:hypothetical protein
VLDGGGIAVRIQMRVWAVLGKGKMEKSVSYQDLRCRGYSGSFCWFISGRAAKSPSDEDLPGLESGVEESDQSTDESWEAGLVPISRSSTFTES